ncbi:putative ATPase component of ABC transporter [Salmonella enterica subsp. enterica serovar Give str. S5-487]|nr:putative ATPase component of ABC transporter [Salmonella enterica subsp. enterica serovar Give str. S5-487]
MKILGGDLEPTLGNVSLDPNERIGKLRQDQFAFEAFTVLDTVIMGHGELWEVKQERDRIYALPEMSEEDGYKVADLEVKYGEMDGYSAEARAGELLLGVGIPLEQHYGLMSEVAPGWKLRVLLAQALFSNPDILLLDEPTNPDILLLDEPTARQIDKIKLEEVKASSRQNPFIRFEQDKKLFRNALEVEALTKGFDNGPLFKNVNLLLEVGEKLAVLGTNGVGKSTLLKTLVGDLDADHGTVKWSENARIGYYAQDHEYEFENDLTVFEWMSQWKQEGDDEQAVRSILGRLLFSQDDIKKPAKVLSGGEKGRMLFGKLMMQKPNILIMDEPTNHLDMESIESLNMALELYQGTLIFVSHDREFVSSLATRVIEITPERVVDFSGNYDDYLRSKGIES